MKNKTQYPEVVRKNPMLSGYYNYALSQGDTKEEAESKMKKLKISLFG